MIDCIQYSLHKNYISKSIYDDSFDEYVVDIFLTHTDNYSPHTMGAWIYRLMDTSQIINPWGYSIVLYPSQYIV